jgi:adenylate cyclase
MTSLHKKYSPQITTVLHIRKLIFSLIWWNMSVHFFVALQFLTKINIDVKTSSHSIIILRENFFLATVVLSLFVFVQWLIDEFYIEKMRARHRLIVTLFLQFLSFVFSFVLISLTIGAFYYSKIKGMPFEQAFLNLKSFWFNYTFLYFFLIGTMIKFSLEFIIEVGNRLGYGMFWKFIIGHYKKPKEENRIFLFIDLVSSTQCSEQLGHVKYSEFLQDCFLIVGNTILRTRGQVYQFVGDEVIVSWDATKKQNFKKALHFPFAFNQDLKLKEKHFLDKYAWMPHFTASLNSGKIMVAEVGLTKSEIAYHGSVLNTTARLQKKCKSYGAFLLSTENFIKQLKTVSEGFKVLELDEVVLSGKKQKEKLFRIDQLCFLENAVNISG